MAPSHHFRSENEMKHTVIILSGALLLSTPAEAKKFYKSDAGVALAAVISNACPDPRLGEAPIAKLDFGEFLAAERDKYLSDELKGVVPPGSVAASIFLPTGGITCQQATNYGKTPVSRKAQRQILAGLSDQSEKHVSLNKIALKGALGFQYRFTVIPYLSSASQGFLARGRKGASPSTTAAMAGALINQKSAMYQAVWMGADLHEQTTVDSLERLCKIDAAQTVDLLAAEIGEALYGLAAFEFNYALALAFKEHFVEKVEKPLAPHMALSHLYSGSASSWPVDRQSYVDSCRQHLEESSGGDLGAMLATVRAKVAETDRSQAEEIATRNYESTVRSAQQACEIGDGLSSRLPSQIAQTIQACEKRLIGLTLEGAAPSGTFLGVSKETGYSSWSDAQREKAATIHAELSAVYETLPAELEKANANEAKCQSLAESIFSKDNVLDWKKCMSAADLTSTARQYAVTDADLYINYIEGKAQSCAGSYNAMVAAAKKCDFVIGGWNSLSDWYDDLKFEYIYDGDEGEVDLEEMVMEKLLPDD